MSLKQWLNKRSLKRAIAGAVAVSMVVPNVAIGVQAEEDGSPVNLVQNAGFESVEMGLPIGWYPGVDYIQEDFEGDVTSEWELNPMGDGAAEIVAGNGSQVLRLKRGSAGSGQNNGRANLNRREVINVNAYSQYAAGAKVKADIVPKTDSKRFYLTTELKDSSGTSLWKWANNVTVFASDALVDWTSIDKVVDVKGKGKSTAVTSSVQLQVLEVETGGEVWVDDFYYVPIGAEDGTLKVVDSVEWYSDSFPVAAGDVLSCTADMTGDGEGSLGLLFADAEGNTDVIAAQVPNGQITVPEGKITAQVVLSQKGEGTSVNFDNICVSVLSVDEAKTKAKDAIENMFSSYVEEEYSATNWAALVQIKDNALTALEGAETIAAINELQSQAVGGMAGILNLVQEEECKNASQEKAYAEIESAYGVYVTNQDAYSPANWDTLVSIKELAVQKITAAASADEVEQLLAAALADMAAVKTELQQAQADAVAKIENAYKQENYFAPEWTELEEKIRGVEETITSLKEIDVIESTVDYAMNSVLNSYETKSDVTARYNITLGTGKSEIKAALQAVYDAIDMETYYPTRQEEIKNIYNSAVTAISDILISKEDLEGIDAGERDSVVSAKLELARAEYDSAVANIQAVATMEMDDADLDRAKDEAIEKVNNYVEGLSKDDYPEENWKNILDNQDVAIDAIAAITDPVNIADAMTLADEAIQTIEGVKTLLQIAKEEAIQTVQAAYDSYRASDYTVNWVQVEAVYNKAAVDTKDEAGEPVLCDINGADNIDDVKAIADQAVKAMADVQSDAVIVDNAKTAAKETLKASFETYSKDDYSEVSYAAIKAIYQMTETDIDAAKIVTTVEDAVKVINECKDKAIEDMKQVTNLVQDAQVEAKAAVEAAFAGYTQADYSPDHWTVLQGYYTEAVGATDEEGQEIKGTIDKADTVEKVNEAKEKALQGMAEVLPLDEELKKAIEDGIQAVNDAYSQYKENDYEASDWKDLTDTKDAAVDTVIPNAATPEAAATAAQAAIDAMQEIPTIAVLLQEAKDAAAEVIKQAYEAYNSDAYRQEQFDVLTAEKEKALENINNAADKDAVEKCKNDGLDAMQKVPTILAETIAAGVEAVNNNFNLYISRKADYSDDNWNALVDIKDEAIIAMEKADDPDIVMQAQLKAIQDMAAVKTMLEEAKETALNAVKAQYEIYQAMQLDAEGNKLENAVYTEDNWTALCAVYADAVGTTGEDGQEITGSIGQAVTVDAVNQAKDEALAAMKDIESTAASELREKYEELTVDSYSQANKSSLDAAYANALQAIQAATTATAMQEAKETGIAAMEAIPNAREEAEAALELAKAINNAKKKLMDVYNAIEEALYTEANYKEITAAKDAGLAALNSSKDQDEIDQNYSDAEAELKGLAERLNEKMIAQIRLSDEYGAYQEGDYSKENWSELGTIYRTAMLDIDDAESAAAADVILEQALADMDGIVSYLDAAKSAAKTALQELYDGKEKASYSQENQASLDAAYTSAIQTVDAAATLEKVEEAKAAGEESLNGILTLLEEAKAAALAEIEAVYRQYPEDAYTTDAYDALTDIFDVAVKSIEEATDSAIIDEIKENVIAEMGEITTIVEDTRESAKTELEQELASYNRNNYSKVNWTELNRIKDQALADIASAETVEDVVDEESGETTLGVNSIKQAAIDAMEVVEALQYSLGDVRPDGEIDVRDALLALRIAVGSLEDASDAQLSAANVDGDLDENGDPNVTANDALAILKYANKLITSF